MSQPWKQAVLASFINIRPQRLWLLIICSSITKYKTKQQKQVVIFCVFSLTRNNSTLILFVPETLWTEFKPWSADVWPVHLWHCGHGWQRILRYAQTELLQPQGEEKTAGIFEHFVSYSHCWSCYLSAEFHTHDGSILFTAFQSQKQLAWQFQDICALFGFAGVNSADSKCCIRVISSNWLSKSLMSLLQMSPLGLSWPTVWLCWGEKSPLVFFCLVLFCDVIVRMMSFFVCCRSRPVITVDVSIFLPVSINISLPQCHEGHPNLNCFNATVCLRFRGRQLPGQIGKKNLLFVLIAECYYLTAIRLLFKSRPFFCMFLDVWVFCGHSSSLPQTKNLLYRSNGDSKVSLSVSVWPWDRMVTFSGCTLPPPNRSWVGASNPMTPKEI